MIHIYCHALMTQYNNKIKTEDEYFNSSVYKEEIINNNYYNSYIGINIIEVIDFFSKKLLNKEIKKTILLTSLFDFLSNALIYIESIINEEILNNLTSCFYEGLSFIKLYPFKDILHYKILEYIKIVIKILINNTFTNLNIDSDNDNNLIDIDILIKLINFTTEFVTDNLSSKYEFSLNKLKVKNLNYSFIIEIGYCINDNIHKIKIL